MPTKRRCTCNCPSHSSSKKHYWNKRGAGEYTKMFAESGLGEYAILWEKQTYSSVYEKHKQKNGKVVERPSARKALAKYPDNKHYAYFDDDFYILRQSGRSAYWERMPAGTYPPPGYKSR